MKEFSFSKQDRLTRRSQFVKLSLTGKRIVGRYFLGIIASGKTPRSRLGVTVTRKVGPAYQRNRIKRLVREHFRRHRGEVSGTWDINIIAKQGAAQATNIALQRDLADLFTEIDLKFNGQAQSH